MQIFSEETKITEITITGPNTINHCISQELLKMIFTKKQLLELRPFEIELFVFESLKRALRLKTMMVSTVEPYSIHRYVMDSKTYRTKSIN